MERKITDQDLLDKMIEALDFTTFNNGGNSMMYNFGERQDVDIVNLIDGNHMNFYGFKHKDEIDKKKPNPKWFFYI